MNRLAELIMLPWRWLKNRRIKPGILLKVYVLLGLAPPKTWPILAHIFDASKSEYLLADWREKYVVLRKDRIIGRVVYCSGEFELEKSEKARALFGKPTKHMVFVDIGANIGTMCIPMVARGHFARAIAIEPEPRNARLLRSNIHLNGVAEQIEVIEAAAGDSTGTAALFLSSNNFGDHYLKADQAAMDSRESVQINVRKLDDLILPGKRENLFLWLDTQGYEGFVLKGATEIIADAPPLVIEFSPDTLNQTGAYEALFHAVLHAPYSKIYDLNEASPAPMPATAETLDKLFKTYLGNGKSTDLFFTR